MFFKITYLLTYYYKNAIINLYSDNKSLGKKASFMSDNDNISAGQEQSKFKKFLPYIIWLVYVLILYFSNDAFNSISTERLDEPSKIGMNVAHAVAAISPIFFRPIASHMFQKIALYVILLLATFIIMRFTIIPLGTLEDSGQQMLRGFCFAISSVLPIIIMKVLYKKMSGNWTD